MQNIIPTLWFDHKAEEAVKFYTSVFQNSAMGTIARYDEASAAVSGMPVGSILTIEFRLEGQDFIALNGGPVFTLTPAVSLFVSCATEGEIDELYRRLSEGGKVLMEFQKYPFSEKYGWFEDKYGLSWQLNLAPKPQKITPCLMYVGAQSGKAEEAMTFYTSVFSALNDKTAGGDASRIITLVRYEAGSKDAGSVMHGVFSLHGQEFMAMDSSLQHDFTFTEALSLMVVCDSQQEVDMLWKKFTEGGEESVCGWLKDRYGVSWQIVPKELNEMLRDKDPHKAKRVMEAMLQMKKIELPKLIQAYKG